MTAKKTTGTVHVTREHIAKGFPCSARACVIAVALHDATGRMYLVDPSAKKAYLAGPGTGYPLPLSAVKLANDFDDGKPIEPMSFEFPLEGFDEAHGLRALEQGERTRGIHDQDGAFWTNHREDGEDDQ